jgi:hypothetical protein
MQRGKNEGYDRPNYSAQQGRYHEHCNINSAVLARSYKLDDVTHVIQLGLKCAIYLTVDFFLKEATGPLDKLFCFALLSLDLLPEFVVGDYQIQRQVADQAP